MTEPRRLRTVAAPSFGEFKDKGSRFLAHAYPFSDAGELKSRIDALRREHFKAAHCVYAYRIGDDGLLFRVNDDGEPAGSAGRPLLGQIDSFGLSDILLAVVRYFGGTLLGVPGLIRAYKSAGACALRRANLIDIVRERTLILECAYQDLNAALKILDRHGGRIIARESGMTCRLEVRLAEAKYPALIRELQAARCGCFPEPPA